MDILDILKSRFVRIYKFGWWYLEIISADEGKQSTSKEFKQECQIHGVHFKFAAPEHQEMNGKVKVK